MWMPERLVFYGDCLPPRRAQAGRNADGKIHKPAGDCIILDLLEVDRIDAGRMRG
mgnify:FL=1